MLALMGSGQKLALNIYTGKMHDPGFYFLLLTNPIFIPAF